MPATLLHPLHKQPTYGLDPRPEPSPIGRCWATRWVALLIIVGYFAVCHGCHGHEDNELFIAPWRTPAPSPGDARVE